MWANALTAGLLTFILFSMFDPAYIAVVMHLDINEHVFRTKSYFYGFIFIWLIFNATTFLNCYFSKLRNNQYVQR